MTYNQIEQEFDAYSGWRERLYSGIIAYRDWLKDQKLIDYQTEQRLDNVLYTLQDDKLHVAFVAEFSRGKSELINAMFFGDLGRRVLPSAAGRTTMCPTELSYDAGSEPSIRLLPIETRSSGTTIAEYKGFAEEWEASPLYINDSEKMSEALHRVTEVKYVTQEHASSMGLPIASEDGTDDGMRVRSDGYVEIPRWRHAIVNYPHPFLEQGLVILDTPGLNALGIEPELTLNMLSTAQATLFVLAADAGVTKSDMALWRDHLYSKESGNAVDRLVVLNKIDVLWDELRDEDALKSELARQIGDTAATLGVPEEQIFPVSAQKALLGKIRADEELVSNSGIVALENALTNMVIPAKQEIICENIRSEVADIGAMVGAMIDQRFNDVNDHIQELEGLNTKNMDVIEDMMDKVRDDKRHLEKNLRNFQATRAIFSRQTNQLYAHLNLAALDRRIAETKKDMEISITTPGLRSSMLKFFRGVDSVMDDAAQQAGEIQELMEGVYRKFQKEHGLANIRPRRFSTNKYQRELKRLEERHDYFVRGMAMVMTEQAVLVRKFYESVVSKVRQIFERANRDADDWLRTIMSPMESQVREHQVQLRRRLESIKRIHKASDTLEDRMAELQHVREGVSGEERKTTELLESVLRNLQGRADGEASPVALEQTA
ncbi:MAG: dynamin family protein [Gammaproteobacteria bacterium]|nr:dynamin family protein [Gammaproteobacteria bacterium]MDH3465187.1 dynamin family protein [Gammaproteobacteria bacterium]